MATSEFGKAFRAARAAGDKVFTFNGKKYTTQMASEVEQPSVGGAMTPGAPKARDLYARSGKATVDAQDEMASKAASMAAYKPRDLYTRSGKAEVDRQDEMARKAESMSAYKPRDEVEDTETYKKGGKVRGWGQARGARKAKFV